MSIADIFPLGILPESGLSHSALPTVFIGLILMTFFTESFGWSYTGLIVPGYLAPIFVSQPWAGAVIIVEAIVTYLLVRLISDYAPRLGIWGNLFGRDRFFAFLIISIMVRLVFELWLFPAVGSFVVSRFSIQFDYRNYLYSVGLVIVPLLANMFWKSGFLKGLIPIFSVTGLTYLATRYILIPCTNFSVARFELLYEDVAIDFLSSPKPYIILITGAFLASRTTLIYGWNYGGIIVPALFALAWFSPTKVLLTIAEAIIVVLIARFITSRKFLETKTIEGPRKILLVFSLGFVLKFIIGHICSYYYPGFKATDLYGFGYLLPTLISIRIWHENIGLAIVPTLRTSIAAVLIGSAAGFLLTFIPMASISEPSESVGESFVQESGDLYSTLRFDRARILPQNAKNSFDKSRPGEMALFERAVGLIVNGIQSNEKAKLMQAASLLKDVGYQMVEYHDTPSDRKYLYLRESADMPDKLHGWGIYIFNMAPSNDLIFEVPRPRSEWKTLEVGEILFKHFDGRALLIAGSHYKTNNDGSSDALEYGRSIYNTVHRHFRTDYIVQVRGTDLDRTTLRVKKDFTLDLNKLASLIGREYDLDWKSDQHLNLQRRSSPRSFVTLELSRGSRSRALSRRLFADTKAVVEQRKLSGYLMDWFSGEKDTIAGKNSQWYRPPSFDEMLYMDEELIKPILEYQSSFASGMPTDGLSILASSASIAGYELVDYTYTMTGDKYLILREKPMEKEGTREPYDKKYWGIYVFKLSNYSPVVVEVPHPLSEVNTFEMGCQMFEYMNAQALLIAGSHRNANANNEADVILPQNSQNIFHLVHQVILRENSPAYTHTIAQIRGFSDQSLYPEDEGKRQDRLVDSDIVLSLSEEVAHEADIPESVGEIEGIFHELGYSVEYFDGAKERVRFAARNNIQYQFTDSHNMGTFLHVWVKRDIRNLYKSYGDSSNLAILLQKMGIQSQTDDLSRWALSFVEKQTSASIEKTTDTDFMEIAELAKQYSRLRNIAYLIRIRHLASTMGYKLLHFVDRASNQEYLIVHPDQHHDRQPITIVNVNQEEGQALRVAFEEVSAESIHGFIQKRLPALIISDYKTQQVATEMPG